MDFWETLASKLEAHRLKQKALFGLNKKPKIPAAPVKPEPMHLQPSWEGSHGLGVGEGLYHPDGSHATIHDKLDEHGNKIN